MKPFFSVIIPALNEEKILPKLLTDLTKQSFSDFEVILVDGHSDDRTVAKAKTFEKKLKLLKIITSDKRSVQYQRNLGVKEAAADWIVFMDADDQLPPYFLQGIKFKLELHKPDLMATWTVPDSNNRTDKTISLLLNILIDMQKSSNTPYVQESLLVAKKSSFNKLHGFNENLHWGEGNDLLVRANKMRMKFIFTREPKYTMSFRRFRKFGTLKGISRSTQMDMARILHIKLPKERASRIYPLEGGQYFEFDPKEKSTIENLFLKLFQWENDNNNGNGKDKKSNKSFWSSVKQKLF